MFLHFTRKSCRQDLAENTMPANFREEGKKKGEVFIKRGDFS